MWKEWETKHGQRDQMRREWREKGSEEDQECKGRTALREIWREWEEEGEQQKIEGVRDC